MKNTEHPVYINRILPISTVDGPGARTSIFVQGCNIACLYCHNPETQGICTSSRQAASGVKLMTATDVFHEIKENLPFIRGITVSGGEATLYPDFLRELFEKVKQENKTCLIDANGTIDLSKYPSLMAVTDGVMIDLKAWDKDVFFRLTGRKKNENLVRNLIYLNSLNKIEEIRLVCLEDYVDVEDCLKGVAETIPDALANTKLKLIAFRSHGVDGPLKNHPSPTPSVMEGYVEYAKSLGFQNIVTR